MAGSTLQFLWIVTIHGALDALFADRADVFVAGDLLWYPVEGEPTIRAAPAVLVAFGRPKEHRCSYRQWKEGNIPPQVVLEVLAPGGRIEMLPKMQFYDQYGVEEFYLLDPDNADLVGYQRTEGRLREIPEMENWTSPRLGVRFERTEGEWSLLHPDGRRFVTYQELEQQRQQAQQRAERLAARLRELGEDPEA